VGCGDGLIGLRAADLVGSTGQVVFSDISPTLLEHCRDAARFAGVQARCAFVISALPELRGIADCSFDVVTDRSVLIYVPDKAAAVTAMHRVLRPGGRIGLFEPINRFTASFDAGRLWGFAVHGAEELAARVNVAAASDAPEADSMLGFDERDLFAMISDAGFVNIRMDYHAEVLDGMPPATSIDAFLSTAPNPLAPTYAELLEQALSPAEAAILRARLTRAFEAGEHRRRSAVVHISARRGN
jgi:ubiquinone/menaquinone biosynthesis C-methylase UbiE